MKLPPFFIWPALACIGLVVGAAGAQQPAQPAAPFQLNKLEQAFLDQVLLSWEEKSKEVETFRCTFQRQDFNAVFGPNMQIPFSIDDGELSFQQPDKGSFQITQIRRWQANQVAPGQAPPAQVPGTWKEDVNAIGEHWVCDGKNVYEYRHQQKQVVVRPIPPQLQGKAIVDGPLPFLFGAEAEKLKERYWIKVLQHPNPDEIRLRAQPKRQLDAANYRAVDLLLLRESMLPKAMKMFLPDGSNHLYIFNLEDASVNAPFAKFKAFFAAPKVPFGWKRVVEEGAAEAPRQASQPGQTPR